MSRKSLFIPLGAFLLLATLLYAGFSLRDPHQLPSALIGKPFPKFSLPDLLTEQPLDQSLLLGQVHLVNVWATWCPTCKAEHGELMRLAKEEGLRIVGINYKDDAQAARRWLQQYGDPYVINVVDADGRLGVDLGVYGAPESFLVDAQGVIRYKIVGDVNRRRWDNELKPALVALRGPHA